MKKKACLFCFFSLFTFVQLKPGNFRALPSVFFLAQVRVPKTCIMGEIEKNGRTIQMSILYLGYEKSTQVWTTLWLWAESEHYSRTLLYSNKYSKNRGPSLGKDGKRAEHRVFCLYGPAIAKHARNEFIFGGVVCYYNPFSTCTMGEAKMCNFRYSCKVLLSEHILSKPLVLDPAVHGMGGPKGSNGDRLGKQWTPAHIQGIPVPGSRSLPGRMVGGLPHPLRS